MRPARPFVRRNIPARRRTAGRWPRARSRNADQRRASRAASPRALRPLPRFGGGRSVAIPPHPTLALRRSADSRPCRAAPRRPLAATAPARSAARRSPATCDANSTLPPPARSPTSRPRHGRHRPTSSRPTRAARSSARPTARSPWRDPTRDGPGRWPNGTQWQLSARHPPQATSTPLGNGSASAPLHRLSATSRPHSASTASQAPRPQAPTAPPPAKLHPSGQTGSAREHPCCHPRVSFIRRHAIPSRCRQRRVTPERPPCRRWRPPVAARGACFPR